MMLWLRKAPIRETLNDGSALVTAILLAISIPSFAPWWIIVIGTAFAVIFAKHLYGGMGYNPFNPAMVGYAMLLISFPVEMSRWTGVYDLLDYHLNFVSTGQWVLFGILPTDVLSIDAITAATPLDNMKTSLGQFHTVSEIKANPLYGDFGGRGWEWIANMYFLGGFWLLYKRVIYWQMPVGVLGSVFVMATIFYLFDLDTNPSGFFHIFSGSTVICAFFIATDPVSAATSPRGRLLYGIGIGLLIYTIRTWGNYPDGVAFAVLLMNMTVPLLDMYTQPRVFGHHIDRNDE